MAGGSTIRCRRWDSATDAATATADPPTAARGGGYGGGGKRGAAAAASAATAHRSRVSRCEASLLVVLLLMRVKPSLVIRCTCLPPRRHLLLMRMTVLPMPCGNRCDGSHSVRII